MLLCSVGRLLAQGDSGLSSQRAETSWGSLKATYPYTPASQSSLSTANESLQYAEEQWALSGYASDASVIPEAPRPPRLVNDFTGILTLEQSNALEERCVDFANQTSNQVAVVIMPLFYGYDKASLAFKIFNKWEIGQQKYSNGVLILIKPKVGDQGGDVFIAVGGGLEPVLTDALIRRVIQLRMIPAFSYNDYYHAIDDALNIIFPVAAGEISTDEFAYKEDDTSSIVVGLIILALLVALFVYMVRKFGVWGALGFILALFLGGVLIGSAARSSQKSSGGSRGRGFGGFGGGSTMGGGAGGSW